MVLSNKLIGAKIAEARKQKKLSQAVLAEKVFISAQAVGKWERGESLPDIVMLARLSEIFEVDLNYFSGTTNSNIENEVIKTETPVEMKAQQTTRWDMSRGEWRDADFSGLGNLNESFRASDMRNCQFVGSDLSGIHFKRNDINECDFSRAKFDDCSIESCEFSRNILQEASLRQTRIIGSDIQKCDFTQADLSYASFKGCDIPRAIFTDAVWKHTQFEGCDIINTTLNGRLEDCSFINCDFNKLTFENANIRSCFFKGVNLKRVQFIDCAADKISYAFLKNGKANLDNVTLIE